MQMRELLEKNSVYSKYQSAYRQFFSTDKAKVTNDLLLNLDRTKSAFYIGLDLSAAFDTLDHKLLLAILETSLGFIGPVLFSCHLVPLEVLFERLDDTVI